jgi:catechol 2,3-dioxygenase-like lactoylglutathione lyase family enzyme
MGIARLDHVNITTDKLDETIAFFENVMGLSSGYRPDFDFPGCWLYSGEQDLVHLVVREGAGKGQDAPLDHFAFQITDYEEFQSRLDKHNIKYAAVEAPDGSRRQMFLKDPNGVLIEVSFRPE